MEAVPIKLTKGEMEVRLTDEALKRFDLDLDEDDWLPIMASFIESKKLHFVTALPWLPEDGSEPTEEEEAWFIPAVIAEKDIEATRFRKLRGSLDDENN